MTPLVYAIILNWNAPQDTIECIESVKKSNYENLSIVLVDNGSRDDSVLVLRKHFPDLDIIENTQNAGFAEGNNIGMRYAMEKEADYFFILNNDVTLAQDCIEKLVKSAESLNYAGMLAPKVCYYDQPDMINSLGTSMDWLRLRPYLGFCGQKDKGQFNDKTIDAQILVGCAIFVKKDTLNRIGLIDKKFFIFHEEADWCLRNIKSGFKNVVIPQAAVYHKASKTMRKFSNLTTYYSIRNFLYLAHKNASLVNKAKTAIGLCFLIFKNVLLLTLTKEMRKPSKAFLLGALDYFKGDMGKCKRQL